ncbi:hypothetical protein [Anaerosoma tenue]|uniref:hypothetical protein n=1 Tax=Anaerosoma tenue TaxID=2933588 RepID=UPI0022609A05|nr:hypothetical protein [Anaerosoma tenue]MCK8115740.1 hypothetical protein [Anaerosoma tenue]
MSGRRRIKGDMRERLDSLSAALRGFIRNPNPFDDPYGCAASTALIVLVAVVILGGMYITGVIDHDFTQTPQERAASGESSLGDASPAPSQESAAPSGPVAENPTAVGQAVDAIAGPAIADVYGDAWLQSAPSVEAPIVSLQYGIPTNPVEGDGEKLRDAFEDRGARVDPANSEMDYHAGEEFMMLIDTGNSAYKSIRVSVSPEYKMVYVNADRSE